MKTIKIHGIGDRVHFVDRALVDDGLGDCTSCGNTHRIDVPQIKKRSIACPDCEHSYTYDTRTASGEVSEVSVHLDEHKPDEVIIEYVIRALIPGRRRGETLAVEEHVYVPSGYVFTRAKDAEARATELRREDTEVKS